MFEMGGDGTGRPCGTRRREAHSDDPSHRRVQPIPKRECCKLCDCTLHQGCCSDTRRSAHRLVQQTASPHVSTWEEHQRKTEEWFLVNRIIEYLRSRPAFRHPPTFGWIPAQASVHRERHHESATGAMYAAKTRRPGRAPRTHGARNQYGL